MSTAPLEAPDVLADGIVRPSALAPGATETLIPSPCVQNHAANLPQLPSGDRACVWFGGTQEGIPDISVRFSRLAAGAKAWTATGRTLRRRRPRPGPDRDADRHARHPRPSADRRHRRRSLVAHLLCRTTPGVAWVGDDGVSAVEIRRDRGRI